MIEGGTRGIWRCKPNEVKTFINKQDICLTQLTLNENNVCDLHYVVHKTLWSIVVFGNISYLGSDASRKRTIHQQRHQRSFLEALLKDWHARIILVSNSFDPGKRSLFLYLKKMWKHLPGSSKQYVMVVILLNFSDV